MKVHTSIFDKVKSLIILTSGLLLIHTSTFAQDNTSMNNVLFHSTVIIETRNGIGYGLIISDSIIIANLSLIYGSGDVSYKFYASDSTYNISAYWSFYKSSDLIFLVRTDLHKNSIKISSDKVLPGQKLMLLGSISDNSFFKSYNGIVINLRYNDDIEIIEINTSAPLSSIAGGPVWNSKNEVVGIYSGKVVANHNGNYAISSSAIIPLLNGLEAESKSLSVLSSEVEELYPQISVGDIKNFSLNINNLSLQNWPEILELLGNILTIESKHFKPIVSDRCIIYESRDGEPIIVAYGNIINIDGDILKIDLIENIISTENYGNTYIFFHKAY